MNVRNLKLQCQLSGKAQVAPKKIDVSKKRKESPNKEIIHPLSVSPS